MHLAEADAAREMKRLLRALAVSGFAAMNIMLLSVSVWAGNGADIAPATRDFFHWFSALIALPAAAYAGLPFFENAWRALKARRLNMDVPISLGVLMALGVSLYETTISARDVYFDSAIMLLFFLLAGRTLDLAMRRKTRALAGNLAALKADTAARMDADGTLHTIPAAAIEVGDTILVRPGERIAADGRVVTGASAVDQSLVTGETAPKPVVAGDIVYAGSLNQGGTLTVAVTAPDGGSLIDEVQKLLDKATEARSRRVRIADRAAQFYAPVRPRNGGAIRDRLARRRWRHPSGDHGRDDGAHHHLPVRAGAGDTRRAGRGFRRALPQGRLPQCRRRHRAAGRDRYRRVRQDRHADTARPRRG